MGFCYGERTVDVGQTMGLKAPLVWVTPSTSINNYELKAQDLGHVQKSLARVYARKSGSEDGLTLATEKLLGPLENDHEAPSMGNPLYKILRDTHTCQVLPRSQPLTLVSENSSDRANKNTDKPEWGVEIPYLPGSAAIATPDLGQ